MTIPSNTESVKPRGHYDSTRRRAQAAQTRNDIVAAALVLFLDQGYVGTTIVAIAKAAGVAVETIYRAFGSKAALFKSVVEAAVAGGARRAMVPVEERPAIKAMIEEQDPRRMLELHASTQPGIHARAGPLHRVLIEAATTDTELARVWTQLEAQRLDGMKSIAGLLSDRGALRPGLSIDEAADVLWTINSLAVYDLLVLKRGWPPSRYRDWIAATNARALLDRGEQSIRRKSSARRER
ncbi:MAG: TetR/AcrR family transcriptional regulator [Chloroflexi bacterium]|nr:MAG: TetR/AcrR family transcriptional regulator [Chloroflexota bacterium]